MKLANITTIELHSFENENNSCIVQIVLMIVVFTIFIGINLVYYNWSLIKNNISYIKFNTRKETEICIKWKK